MTVEERLARLEQAIEYMRQDMQDMKKKINDLYQYVFTACRCSKTNSNGYIYKIVIPLSAAIAFLSMVILKIVGG